MSRRLVWWTASSMLIPRPKRCVFEEGLRYRDVTHHVSYKLFRGQIIQGGSSEVPTASTPLATREQCKPSFEFDAVCQRLDLDSPPRSDPGQRVPQETVLVKDVAVALQSTPHHTTTWKNTSEEALAWRAAVQEHVNLPQAGSNGRQHDFQPFTLLEKDSVSLKGKSVMKLAASPLLDDYYTNLLDCSCNGMIALALGSSVYLWNSETRVLVGHLETSKQPGGPADCRAISCLCWSRDGRALCIGTRRGAIQWWDVELKQSMMSSLPTHLSAVRALSWKQHLLSSGSALGHIHHLDPRASTPLIGAAVQNEGISSLQWSPGGDWLASGSTEGHLRIWDCDITEQSRSRQPITTMKQLSAVKAMGWCPWQGKMIATGGGWKDGVLRIWDTESRTCVTSAYTNSQICALQWAEKKRCLITGHGLPGHHITCWTWKFPFLSSNYQLTGHSERVLHLALNADCSHIFSAGADQRFHIWDM